MKCRKISDEPYNPHLRSTILEIVDNQLSENNPPETKLTFQRLIELGYTELQAKEKIGAVVTEQIYYTMKYKKAFNLEKFIEGLDRLN